MTGWHEEKAALSSMVDDEFGQTSIGFIPMAEGAGPQSKRTPDQTRPAIPDLCALWSERHERSDLRRNNPRGERFKEANTDVSKMNIYVSVDCRTIPVIRDGDRFTHNGKTYAVVDQRPDGAMRVRCDLVLVKGSV
jgi:hypothetical protein